MLITLRDVPPTDGEAIGMRKFVLALVATAVTAGALAAPAAAEPSGAVDIGGSLIIGGTRSPVIPWMVNDIGCTGEQINDSWVLTARHCVEHRPLTVPIFQSNQIPPPPTAEPIPVAENVIAPNGDIALQHLARPAPLPYYAPLNLSFTAVTGGRGLAIGYGQRAFGATPDGLYQASMELVRPYSDGYGGPAQQVFGIDGSVNFGDSGGALLVNGAIVGIASSADAPRDNNIHGGANFALLSQAADWIKRTAGI